MSSNDKLIFQALIEQNRLMWSRIQTIYVLQAAVVTAWYMVWRGDVWQLGLIISAGGMLATFLVMLVAERDTNYVDAYLGELQAAGVLPPPQPEKPWWRGRRCLLAIICLAVLGNLAMVFLSIFWRG